MSHQNLSSSTTGPDAWAPSMPDSDLWTLRSARDAVQLMSPQIRARHTIIPKRVVAVRTSPLGRYLPLTASTSVAGSTGSASVLSPAATLSQEPPSPLQSATPAQTPPASSHATIGLGHPSTSKRRCLPLESDSAALASQDSPQKRARINSSTIKRRTERFPARALDSIAEHPVTPADSQHPEGTARPVHGARKRSYAEAASGAETFTLRTGRHIAPTTTSSTSASPTTLTPVSPRCASTSRKLSPGGASMVLAPRSTSAGAPQAGPTQVQSPRLLMPATMAGSPNFQSLDGAVLAITQALSEERGEVEVEETEKEETEVERVLDDLIYGEEDGLMKFRVHAHLRIRFAARRLKTLF